MYIPDLFLASLQRRSMLCYEKSIFQKSLSHKRKIEYLSSLLYSTKWDIDDLNSFIIEYYIDSHYSLLFESRVFKGLNIYWPSTVVSFFPFLRVNWFLLRLPTSSFFQRNLAKYRAKNKTDFTVFCKGTFVYNSKY